MSFGATGHGGRVDAYMASVRRTLGAASAERFLAEIYDHLVEATAEGLDRGLDQAAAEARAVELFGLPELVARQYAAELAEARLEQHMHRLRFIASAFAVLTVYYARFFVAVRQEAATLVQIGVLLCAAAVLSLPLHFAYGGAPWFRGWRPISGMGWVTAGVALGLGAVFFAWADHDSHSASDTLNRAVPTLCLIAAIALRIAHQRNASRPIATSD